MGKHDCGRVTPNVRTYIERIVLPHLTRELLLDPLPHLGATLLIEPAQALNLSDDPFPLALLCEDPCETDIVGRSPEGEVTQEENLRCAPRECEEQRELCPEQREIEQIDMRFGVARVEEC